MGMTTTVPPANSVGRVIWPSPRIWNSGAEHRLTSAREMLTCANWLTVFQVRLPCVSTAPLGRPVVPEV